MNVNQFFSVLIRLMEVCWNKDLYYRGDIIKKKTNTSLCSLSAYGECDLKNSSFTLFEGTGPSSGDTAALILIGRH